ncbi:MAG: TonB-dependent receptor plug domain-containing protein [Thermodesulfobacteriota bacterium]
MGHFAEAQDEAIEGEPPRSLEPVVVTGTLNPASLSQTPASVTVITREQIEERNPSSVAEILQQVPGLYVDQPASRGGVTSVYIRGGDPNFTLVLIDGVKVNDPTNNRGGSFDFSTLSPDNIERIEIVRDPMSSLYGSDALSGVINIVTKKGRVSRRPLPRALMEDTASTAFWAVYRAPVIFTITPSRGPGSTTASR